MYSIDGRGRAVGVGSPARSAMSASAQMAPSRRADADYRRFRLRHALRAVEDALVLLEPRPVEGLELASLARVRDDLAVALRMAERAAAR
jgi:hypothetical protein